MQFEADALAGDESDVLPESCYPWSWPKTLPPGGEVACPFVRDTLRMAEAIARRRFGGSPGADELVCDAVSTAWEMAQVPGNRERGHPGTIALFAVRRVVCGRHFTESVRSMEALGEESTARPKREAFFEAFMAVSKTSGPAEATSFALDFEAWLAGLTVRQREVAFLLATGHTTTEIAEMSDCTTNAVRMIRMALRRSYNAFLANADYPAESALG